MGFVYSKAVVLGLLSSRPIDPRYPDHHGLNVSIWKHTHRETSMFKAHLMEVAATGIFQVTEMELKHLLLQLTELDSRLFDKSFVDLLYLFCNGNGAKQKKKKKFGHYGPIPYPLCSTSFNPQGLKLWKIFPRWSRGKGSMS